MMAAFRPIVLVHILFVLCLALAALSLWQPPDQADPAHALATNPFESETWAALSYARPDLRVDLLLLARVLAPDFEHARIQAQKILPTP